MSQRGKNRQFPVKTVSAASRDLGLSQPTVSAALARLRRHFADPLVTRQGNRSGLTALGEELRPRVAAALRAAEFVFEPSNTFAAATSTRMFTLLSQDHWTATLGARLARSVGAAAPGVTLHFFRPDTALLVHPAVRLAGVDGALGRRCQRIRASFLILPLRLARFPVWPAQRLLEGRLTSARPRTRSSCAG